MTDSCSCMRVVSITCIYCITVYISIYNYIGPVLCHTTGVTVYTDSYKALPGIVTSACSVRVLRLSGDVAAPVAGHVSLPSMGVGSVAVVMLDSRPPSLASLASANVSLKSVTAHALAYYQNLKWACHNGYSMYFFRLEGGGCNHPLWGLRHPSYCKLSAMSHALSLGHSWAVFLDSDAMIRNAASLDLPSLLRAYGGSVEDDAVPSAFFAWDTPYS